MESDSYMHLDHPNGIPMIINGIPSQSMSESNLRTNFFEQNTQNDSMLGLPLLTSLQGQCYKAIHSDKAVCYDGLIDRSNSIFQDLCLGGSPFAPSSLPMVLPPRNGLNDDANNSIMSLQQEVPPESLREMFTSGISYASSSSIPTINCSYDGSVGDLNDKWDHNGILMHQEMNWRASTSGLEPIPFNCSENATNEWLLPSSSTSHPLGFSTCHNELSLSLATSRSSLPSDLSSSVFHSSSQTRLSSERSSHRSNELPHGCTSNSRSAEVSPVISGSRYHSVLQQILSEIASFSLDSLDSTSYKNCMSSSSNHPFSANHLFDPGSSFNNPNEFDDNDRSFEIPSGSSKKSQMLALLQMVDDRYNRCLDEIHMVISAFHAATELDPQLHSYFALQTISFFYKNLRERISNQILAMGMDSGSPRYSNGRSFDKSFIQKQWTIQQMKRKDQMWRPQRGLPERSVSVLRAWMFDNFLHPYPKDAEKHLLAIKSGLTRSQVSNWFINARVRLWKPLVEEMCSELNRKKGSRQHDEESNNNNDSRSQLCVYEYNQR